jgi:hypothetical protein
MLLKSPLDTLQENEYSIFIIMFEVKTTVEPRVGEEPIDSDYVLAWAGTGEWRVTNLFTDAVKKLRKPKYLLDSNLFASDEFFSTWDKQNNFAPVTLVDDWIGHDTFNFDAELESVLNTTNSKGMFLPFSRVKLIATTYFLKDHFAQETFAAPNYYRSLLVPRNSLFHANDYSDITPGSASLFPFPPNSQISNFEFKADVLETISTQCCFVEIGKYLSEIAEDLYASKRARLIEFAELVDNLLCKLVTKIVCAVCPIAIRPVTLSSSVEAKEGEQLWPLLMAFKNH